MSTGNWSIGYSKPVSTNSGPGWLINQSQKRWNGVNSGRQTTAYRRERDRRVAQLKALRLQGRYAEAAQAAGDFHYWRSLPRRPNALAGGANPYTAYGSTVIDDAVLSYEVTPGVLKTCTWQNVQGAGVIDFPAVDAADVYRLQGKLRNDLCGSDFNLASFLGEGSEACHMIFNAARTLALGLNRFKAGDVKGVYNAFTTYGLHPNQVSVSGLERVTNDAAAAWLQFNWGWKPLVRDVIAGAEMLAHFTEMPFQQRYVNRIRLPISVRPTSPAYQWQGELFGERFLRLQANIREANGLKLAGLDGWGAAQGAWEVLPYSWWVDYLVPVGDYLSARGLAQAVKGTFITTEFWNARINAFGFSPASGGSFPRCTGAAFKFHKWWMQRTVSSSLQVPLPTVRPLGLVDSWRKAANQVAVLITQAESFHNGRL